MSKHRAPRPVRFALTAAAVVVVAATAATVPATAATAAGGVSAMYDVDADGLVDPSAFDTNGDGWLDQNVVVLAGYRAWLFDQDQDSRVDQYGVDGTRDGLVDIWLFDSDQNGVLEGTTHDAAAYPSRAVVSAPGQGISFTVAAAPFTLGDALQAGATDPCAFYNGVAFATTGWTCVNR